MFLTVFSVASNLSGICFYSFCWHKGIKHSSSWGFDLLTGSKDGGHVTSAHQCQPELNRCVSLKEILCHQWQPRCVGIWLDSVHFLESGVYPSRTGPQSITFILEPPANLMWMLLDLGQTQTGVHLPVTLFTPPPVITSTESGFYNKMSRAWWSWGTRKRSWCISEVRTKQAKTRGTRLDQLLRDRKQDNPTAGEKVNRDQLYLISIYHNLSNPSRSVFRGGFWSSAGKPRGYRPERGRTFPQRKTEETPDLLGATHRSLCRWLDYVWGHGEGRSTANQPC